jgi:NitT/TauT family transport system permease protein
MIANNPTEKSTRHVATPRPSRRWLTKGRITSVVYPMVALALVVVGWAVVKKVFDIKDYLLPSPSAVFSTLRREASYLFEQSMTTLQEVLIGFALAAVVGVLIGIAIATWRPFEQAVYPLLVASQEIPQVAFAPLLLVWFGFGITSKVIIAFLIAFFPIVVNTAVGLRSVPPELVDLARATRAPAHKVLRKIRFPHALPHVFTGLKIGATFAVIGAVVGEFVGAGNGLGYVLVTANGRLNTALMFAAIIVLVILGLGLFFIISVIERLVIPWHASQRRNTAG